MTDSKDDKPKLTIEIAPGAFDNFNGTQEELDELIADITRMAETGELLEQSQPLDLEELFEEDPEAALRLANDLGLFEDVVDENGDEVSFEEIRDAMREERKRKLN
jgi:hypothetical protein